MKTQQQAEKFFYSAVINLGISRSKEIMENIEQRIAVFLLPETGRKARKFPASHASETSAVELSSAEEKILKLCTPEEDAELEQAQDHLHETGESPMLEQLRAGSINRSKAAQEMILENPGLRIRQYTDMLKEKHPDVKSNWYTIVYNLTNPKQSGYKGFRREGKCVFPPA